VKVQPRMTHINGYFNSDIILQYLIIDIMYYIDTHL